MYQARILFEYFEFWLEFRITRFGFNSKMKQVLVQIFEFASYLKKADLPRCVK